MAFLAPPPDRGSRAAGGHASASSSAGVALATGLTDLRASRYASAEEHLRQAVEENPRSAAAHYYLGYSYYLMSRDEPPGSEHARKAAAEVAHAYRLDPTFKPEWGKE